MKTLLIGLLSVFMAASAVHAAAFQNGDFEAPVANADWQNIDIDTEADLLTGWTLIAPEAGHIATLYSSNFDFWGALPGLTNGQYLLVLADPMVLLVTRSSRPLIRLQVFLFWLPTMSV
jgi:hypothetical protein